MADKAMDNNQVTIVGTVDSEFTYSHEVFGEGFYMLEVVVNRLSHMEDRIPLMVSERLVDVKESYRGKIVEVHGQFRSYNKHEESRNRLILSVFVREFAFVGGRRNDDKAEQHLSGWLYLQTAGISDDTSWT